jgi:hypothetical protein
VDLTALQSGSQGAPFEIQCYLTDFDGTPLGQFP